MRVLAGRYVWAAGVVGAVAAALGWAFPPAARVSVWVGAGLALAVQAACFCALWAGARRGGTGFLAAWAGGVAMRLAALLALGFWGVEALDLVPAPALFSLVGALFLLVLLEPVALKPEMSTARA